MSYTLVGFDTRNLQTLNRYSYIETVVRNNLTASMFFGFLGAHGKRLAALGDSALGDYYTTTGALETTLHGIPGRRFRRHMEHFKNACLNGLISVRENKRHVVHVPVADTATAIAKGDLIYWDATAGKAKSAAEFPWTVNLTTTQSYFAEAFLGVSLDAKATSDGRVILRVDISPDSYWDFTTGSNTHLITDMFAPAKAAGNALLPSTLVQVAHTYAIARCSRPDTVAKTNTLVRIQSAFWGYEWSGVEGPQRYF